MTMKDCKKCNGDGYNYEAGRMTPTRCECQDRPFSLVSKKPILYKGTDYQVTDVDKINDDEYLYEFMSRHGELIYVTSEEYEADRK